MVKKYSLITYLITSVILFLSTAILSGLTYADETVPERIRVGLFYGDTALEQVTIDADHGFSFGIYGDDQYFELFDLSDYDSLLFENDLYYHVQIEDSFKDSDDFIEFYDAMKGTDDQFFAGYDGKWHLYYGAYGSQSSASDALDSLEDQYSDLDMTILGPNTDRIQLSQYGEHVFIYTADADYVLKDIVKNSDDEVIRIGNAAYRDGVIVKPQWDGRLTVMNTLSMQFYLYGVVPKEMSKDWPLEALKAQAVAARNYALLSFGKHTSEGFDICATTHCQAYGGYYSEAPLSNEAVDATKGLLLYYNSDLVQTFYHSNSGGQTENSENVWSSEIPYLRGVSDPYSMDSPNSNWSATLSKSTIRNCLASYGYDIGSIDTIEIVEKSINGRVQKLKVNGSSGSVVLNKEETRKIFGYSTIKSTWFSFGSTQGISLMTSRGQHSSSDSRLSVFNGTTASNLEVDVLSVYNGKTFGTVENKESQTGSNFVFYGHGYGHGLGMSQWGAKNMAEQGFDFEEILTHYYVDTHIQ